MCRILLCPLSPPNRRDELEIRSLIRVIRGSAGEVVQVAHGMEGGWLGLPYEHNRCHSQIKVISTYVQAA